MLYKQQQVVQLKPPLCFAIYLHFLNKKLSELYLNGPDVCFIANQTTVVPFKRKKPRCINRTIIHDAVQYVPVHVHVRCYFVLSVQLLKLSTKRKSSISYPFLASRIFSSGVISILHASTNRYQHSNPPDITRHVRHTKKIIVHVFH